MNWTNKKVLVTGAGGFIGSHLVTELARRGAAVRALVRYRSDGSFGWLHDVESELMKSVEVAQGDLRDSERVLSVVKGVDIVFHLGAMISIPYSYVSPSEAVAVNVVGTQNILNACRHFDVPRMIHTSTSEVYGSALYVPIDEKHPLQGQSPYSASKIGADKLAESYFNAFGLPTTTVRPFNTFGPRQSARAVIPTVIAQLLARAKIKLGSLTPTRDFTFVTDTVRGMIMAAESEKAIGRTFNLGTMSEISIGDLVATLGRLMDAAPEIETEAIRIRPGKSEVTRLLSNNELSKELIGWSPEVSLEDGLRRTIAWMRDHQGAYERARKGYVV